MFKEKFKYILSGVIGITATGLLLAGCSSASSNDSNGKTTLQFFSTKTENASTYKKLISKFEKQNPNISVKLSSPSNAGTVLKSYLSKNSIPDVMAVGGDANFLQLEKAHVLKDLSGQSYVNKTQPVYQKMITSLYSGNKLYAVPYAINASGVIYNKKLFAQAGITKTPTTWSEFINDCKILKSKNITPIEFTFKDSWTTLAVFNQLSANMISKNWINKRLDNKTTFAKTHKQVMAKYLELLNYGQSDYTGTSYNDGVAAFAKDKAAMMINGNFVIPGITQLNKNADLGMFMLPVNENASQNKVTSGVDVAFAISNKTEHTKAAEKFVKFLMENGNAKQYTKEQFAFSAVKNVKQDSALVSGISPQLEKGQVVNYPDHYYPSALDLTKVLTQTGVNAKSGMSTSKNITQSLENADKAFNSANIKE
ncbi:MAG: extracellular solute-binding protein [Liquorilactobacillus hordei]|uniref:ABC transporter substrate-binding protein n=1 Tax=Liquorilactobacillus hordei TaxID=468911 RepID=A0A3Q8CD77_9LACO|nr:extracellular solute-binding protein [Liquorilactobacillus hordei]AUJ30585.1 ABC transporter substrate-binding protein [Liquorilactobacillus hordei]